MTINLFSVPVFFVIFREGLEIVVIVSVLFAFLKQTLGGPESDPVVFKKLRWQVWWGVILGLAICLVIGAAMIAVFYVKGVDSYSNTEDYWEGSFAIVASIIIAILGAALLRVSKMKEKFAGKLAVAMTSKIEHSSGQKGRWKRFAEKYAMFVLPFITVLREGLEAIVFIAGVTFSSPATSVPIPVITGLLAGSFVGYLLYKGGASSRLQYFLIVSTCVLYLVAAGLFSRGVWYLQSAAWTKMIGSDLDGLSSGPGTYDIGTSVWHINFGNPEINGGGGWGIFNAILGWQNSATYGSVISYNIYWIAVGLGFISMRYKEVHGHWPLLKAKKVVDTPESGSPNGLFVVESGDTLPGGTTNSEKDIEKAAVDVSEVRVSPTRTIEEA